MKYGKLTPREFQKLAEDLRDFYGRELTDSQVTCIANDELRIMQHAADLLKKKPFNKSLMLVEAIRAYYRVGRKSPKKVALPPGTRALRLTGVLFGRKANSNVFGPLVADFRQEYFDLLSEKPPRIWAARFVLVRGYSALFDAMLFRPIVRLLGKALKTNIDS